MTTPLMREASDRRTGFYSTKNLKGWRSYMALGEYYHLLACEWRDVHKINNPMARLASGRAYMAARVMRDGYPS